MSDPEVWCVLIMKGRAVSILKGLTEAECQVVVQRVRGGNPWSQDAIYQKVLAQAGQHAQQAQQTMPGAIRNVMISGFHSCDPSPGWGVERCEWWGSRGSELEIWPKPADYDARLAEAMKVLATVQRTNAATRQGLAA